jgi:predicted nucleic acid-binding protein
VKKIVYFDTSALIKEFVDEVGSDLISKVTASAAEGNIQIISSVWSLNEAIAVIDRLSRPKEKERDSPILSQSEVQQIIATIAERVRNSRQDANFFFQPIDHQIVSNSRLLIREFHISPDDALHVYTAWVRDCDYFLFQDKNLSKRIPKVNGNLRVIDLAEKAERTLLESHLSL